jgi:hypothetical protein
MTDPTTADARRAAYEAWLETLTEPTDHDAWFAGYDSRDAELDRLKAENAGLRDNLRGALKWLGILCEEADIDPDETCVRVNAINRETDAKREIAVVCLGEMMKRYAANLAATALTMEAGG